MIRERLKIVTIDFDLEKNQINLEKIYFLISQLKQLNIKLKKKTKKNNDN